MTVKTVRHQFTKSNRQLRRARNLYVFLCRYHVLGCGADELLRLCHHVKAQGLYAESSLLKDVGWSILRKTWKATRLPAETWDEWRMRTGWRPPKGHGQFWTRSPVQLQLLR